MRCWFVAVVIYRWSTHICLNTAATYIVNVGFVVCCLGVYRAKEKMRFAVSRTL